MASIIQLKTRTRSVKNTRQITGAMQLVAASKMRRAADRSLKMRPYHRQISELLAALKAQGLKDGHPLMQERDVKSKLLILIAGDTGLAGSYNTNVLKKYLNEIEKNRANHIKTTTLTIGKKATQLVAKIGEQNLGAYDEIDNREITLENRVIVDMATKKFLAGEVDAVEIIYTEYYSSLRQEASKWRLLPAGEIREKPIAADLYKFEPSKEEVFERLIRKSLEVQLAHAIFDSLASEHSMRMMAMKNATDNADDLIEDLTLAMNKERQTMITNELSDISNGANAVGA